MSKQIYLELVPEKIKSFYNFIRENKLHFYWEKQKKEDGSMKYYFEIDVKVGVQEYLNQFEGIKYKLCPFSNGDYYKGYLPNENLIHYLYDLECILNPRKPGNYSHKEYIHMCG